MTSQALNQGSQENRYEEFGLRIERVGDAYAAMVTRCLRGDPDESALFTPPCDDAAAQALVNEVARAIERDAAYPPSAPPPEMAKLEDFGRRLYDAIFAKNQSLRECYLASLAAAQNSGKGLRLKLHVHRSLAGLPWELLYGNCGQDEGFLALSTGTPIVRFMAPYAPNRFPPVEGQLRILAVFANPDDGRYPLLDMDQEKKVLEEALKPWTAGSSKPLAKVDYVEGHNTIRQLQDLLGREDYEVLHFSGHGCYDTARAKGSLVMEGPHGGSDEVEERRLLTMLLGDGAHAPRARHNLRLVFLNSCNGAENTPSQPFSGLARSLVRSGVPAVVAMQYPVSDLAATELTSKFYLALLKRYPVDAALTVARQSIYVTWGYSLEWTTPVLYMLQSDDMAFDLARPAEIEQVWQSFHHLESQYQRARQEAAAGHHRAAVAALKIIVDAQPGYRDAANLLDASQRVLDRVQDLLTRAKQSLATHSYEQALSAVEEAQMLERGNAEAAELRIRAADLLRAVTDLDRACAALGSPPQEAQMRAVSATAAQVLNLEAGHPQAQARQQEALQWLRLEAEYRRLLDLAEAEEWGKAFDCAQRILEVNPSFRDVPARRERLEQAWRAVQDRLWSEAVRRANAGQLEEALEALRKLSEVNPKHPDAPALQRRIEAIRDVDVKVGEPQSDRETEVRRLLEQAQQADRNRRWKDVVTSCQRLLALSPGHATAQELLTQAQQWLDIEEKVKLRGRPRPASGGGPSEGSGR